MSIDNKKVDHAITTEQHDPVCGISVTNDTKFHTMHKDATYQFCSENCLHKFEKNPDEYLKDPEEQHDPVCGMMVTDENKLHVEHKNKTYRFCSENCLHKFEKNPQEYLDKKTQTESDDNAGDDATYTCPMHPEVEQQGPGACPKCGMALEPKGVPVVATKTQYTCPMHP